jgi:ABC-type multidrug transport system fused ATPase/permease subunit
VFVKDGTFEWGKPPALMGQGDGLHKGKPPPRGGVTPGGGAGEEKKKGAEVEEAAQGKEGGGKGEKMEAASGEEKEEKREEKEDVEMPPTLRNINLDVKPGQLVMIIGGVGSGKSSLVAALLGLIPAKTGSVGVGGAVAYVSQVNLGKFRQICRAAKYVSTLK